MHQCSMLLPSGMMTVKVRASSRLEQAIEKAKEHAQYNIIFVNINNIKF